MTSVTIDPKDTLTIIGTKTDKNVANTTTLFQSKGSPQRGLVSLSGYNNVIVQLNLTALASNSSNDRVFYSVYYWNAPINLQRSEGQMTLPLNSDKTPITAAKLEIKPGAQFDDQVIMLSFIQLPKNASNKVTVDGVILTATSPTVFLQSKPTVTVTLDLPSVEQIAFRYWLVNAKCSETAALKTNEKKAIRFPDAADRKVRQLSAVRCGMYYSTDVGNKFVVHVPSPSGLADPGDSVNFYDGQGNVALGLNNPAVRYFSDVNTLIETNTAVVLYESPYVTSPNAAFQAPEIKAIPTTQG